MRGDNAISLFLVSRSRIISKFVASLTDSLSSLSVKGKEGFRESSSETFLR